MTMQRGLSTVTVRSTEIKCTTAEQLPKRGVKKAARAGDALASDQLTWTAILIQAGILSSDSPQLVSMRHLTWRNTARGSSVHDEPPIILKQAPASVCSYGSQRGHHLEGKLGDAPWCSA